MSYKTIRKGDLVMCVGGQHELCKEHIGKIAKTVGLYRGKYWELDPPTISSTGKEMTWRPSDLRKIDPPATGEYDGVSVRKPIKQREPA